MKTLSIGELSRRTGVRTSALRYYEDAGVLPKPGRANGRRVYDLDSINRVDVLRFAQQAGFTLDEIKILFHGFKSTTPLSARWQKLARSKLDELESLGQQIERMKNALKLGLQCGCIRVEDCKLSAADADDPAVSPARAGGCSC